MLKCHLLSFCPDLMSIIEIQLEGLPYRCAK